MADLDLMRSLTQKGDTKIVLLIMDGLGGLPREAGGPTELEAALTPNMDHMAREGMLGLMHTVGIGISPWKRSRTPRAFRVRSAEVRNRKGCPGSGRNRRISDRSGCGREGEFLYLWTVKGLLRTAARAEYPPKNARAWWI